MRRLNTVSMGIKNLLRQKGRTSIMIIFSFVLTMSLFVCTIVTESMQQSVDKTINRMGADIIVVPEEYETEYTESLFSGELCTFYFEKEWYEKVCTIEGIKVASPQLYLASLSASCCAAPVQLIAFDPETDFIVQPWMKELDIEALQADEVLVGDNISGNVGDTIVFYGKELTIAGRLENTDTSYDLSAFVNFETAQTLLKTEQAQMTSVGDLDPDTLVSTIMIRAEEGTDVKALARKINFGIDDCPLKAYTTDGITSSITASVDSFAMFSKVLNILLFLMAVLAIICIFTITILQRKKEFGILITIGASKRNLNTMILTEGICIGIFGGLLGVLVSGGIILALKEVILNILQIPTFITEFHFYVKIAAACTAVSLVTGLLASFFAIAAVTAKEPLDMIQEENV